ncbi:MAG: hypothetical protein FJX75_25670 [Armatimonadetes bacterium]|nr:hypothetical protein [Armatimonadota bacterium]
MPRRGDEIRFCEGCKAKGIRTRVERGDRLCSACRLKEWAQGRAEEMRAATPSAGTSPRRPPEAGTQETPAADEVVTDRPPPAPASPLTKAEEDKVVAELQGTLDAIRAGRPVPAPVAASRPLPKRREGGQTECTECGFLLEPLDTHCRRCGLARAASASAPQAAEWWVYGTVRASSSEEVTDSVELVVTSEGVYVRDWMAGRSCWSWAASKLAGGVGALLGLAVGAVMCAVAQVGETIAAFFLLMCASLAGGLAYGAVAYLTTRSRRRQLRVRTRAALRNQAGVLFVPLDEVTARLRLDDGGFTRRLQVLGSEPPTHLTLPSDRAERLLKLLAQARGQPSLGLDPPPPELSPGP